MTDFLSICSQRFEACFAQALAEAPAEKDNLLLKRDHCLRVLAEARMITASFAPPLSEQDLETIHVAALLHDVGRFEQLRRYGTFNDSLSANHGILGVQAIVQHNLLEGLSRARRKVVRSAVILHNRRLLPKGLPAEIDLAARVIRDADKLDIFPVMLAHFGPEAGGNDVVTLGLRHHATDYTPAILAQVHSRQLAEYGLMETVNDFKLLLLSWVYGLEFQASHQALLERGYVDQLLATLPDLDVFRSLGDRLRKDLARKTTGT